MSWVDSGELPDSSSPTLRRSSNSDNGPPSRDSNPARGGEELRLSDVTKADLYEHYDVLCKP